MAHKGESGLNKPMIYEAEFNPPKLVWVLMTVFILGLVGFLLYSVGQPGV
jgi:hypothetical protein